MEYEQVLPASQTGPVSVPKAQPIELPSMSSGGGLGMPSQFGGEGLLSGYKMEILNVDHTRCHVWKLCLPL
jgi:hypothetical protein